MPWKRILGAAARVGFEPTERSPARALSRRLHSSTMRPRPTRPGGAQRPEPSGRGSPMLGMAGWRGEVRSSWSSPVGLRCWGREVDRPEPGAGEVLVEVAGGRGQPGRPAAAAGTLPAAAGRQRDHRARGRRHRRRARCGGRRLGGRGPLRGPAGRRWVRRVRRRAGRARSSRPRPACRPWRRPECSRWPRPCSSNLDPGPAGLRRDLPGPRRGRRDRLLRHPVREGSRERP